MSQDLDKTKETHDTPDNPGDSPGNTDQNGAATDDELEVLKAQLQEELDARAQAQAALTEKDDRISELELNLTQLQSNLEATQENLGTLNDAAAAVTEKYLEAQRALHPDVPADLIKGATLEEIEDSVQSALTMVNLVKTRMAAEASNSRVPAGAPTRQVNLEGLTADELIRLGIQEQQGGGSA